MENDLRLTDQGNLDNYNLKAVLEARIPQRFGMQIIPWNFMKTWEFKKWFRLSRNIVTTRRLHGC